jgi:hypothetical protein
MPGCTFPIFPVGPAQVRVGNIELVGPLRRRIGRILRFDDGTKRELRRGQMILVSRPAARVATHG